MKRHLFRVIIALYILVSAIVTTFLLHFNDYRVSVFGDNSIILSDGSIDGYSDGSLLIVEKDLDDISKGDKIFFYNTYDKDVSIELETVMGIDDITGSEKTFLLSNGKYLSSEYIIGNVDDTEVIGLVGYMLGLLESKWGFLFIIILPMLLLLMYEISMLIRIMKPDRKKKGKKKNG